MDEGLDGAPVAVVLAWNTDRVEDSKRRTLEVENPLKTEYVALWSRLPTPIDIPALPVEHAAAFAIAYVEAENIRFRQTHKSAQNESVARFVSALNSELSGTLKRVPDYGRLPDGAIIERAWLNTLRSWADEFVKRNRG